MRFTLSSILIKPENNTSFNEMRVLPMELQVDTVDGGGDDDDDDDGDDNGNDDDGDEDYDDEKKKKKKRKLKKKAVEEVCGERKSSRLMQMKKESDQVSIKMRVEGVIFSLVSFTIYDLSLR